MLELWPPNPKEFDKAALMFNLSFLGPTNSFVSCSSFISQGDYEFFFCLRTLNGGLCVGIELIRSAWNNKSQQNY